MSALLWYKIPDLWHAVYARIHLRSLSLTFNETRGDKDHVNGIDSIHQYLALVRFLKKSCANKSFLELT